jgi:hypothetical protein
MRLGLYEVDVGLR